MLAQITATAPDWPIFAAQSGMAGLVLWWFMARMERLLRGQEIANTRLARSQLLLVISLDYANKAAKQEAREMIEAIDVTLAKSAKPEAE